VEGPTVIEYVEVLWACSKGALAPKAHNAVRSKHGRRVDVCLAFTIIIKGVGIAHLPKWRKMVEERRIP
jgi:hypothetical protein